MTDFNFIQKSIKSPNALDINFNFGANVYYLLEGQSNIMSAVWTDSNTSRTSGKVGITSIGVGAALSVLELELKILYDRYTSELKGRANELLEQEDPKDVII